MKTDESVLDAPKPALDPSVWQMNDDEQPKLTSDAQHKIQKAIDYIQSKFKFPNLKVYIIGSITSNSYSEDSDIDINLFDPSFAKMTEDERLALATEVKNDFQTNYMDVYPSESMVGTHPFEIYIQNNVFKCFASVGCYDFFEQRWEVGPDFKDLDFDPISHYYSKSMRYAKSFIEELRQLILAAYENALIATKSNDEEFKAKQKEDLVKKLEDAKELYGNIKKARAKYDDDLASIEDAARRRKNEKWHTVDAAYKLMDKFGYIHILKELAELYNRIDNGEIIDNIDSLVVDAVKSAFAQKLINDSELCSSISEKEIFEDEQLAKDGNANYAYHVSNIPPAVIKKKGFKAGLGNGGTDTNLFDELYQQDYPKNYLFISKQPWDEDRNEKFKYCYKIDVTDLDFYPDFGMLVENGAYYEESGDDYVFYWRDKDLKFMKNKQLKRLLEMQDGEMTVNDMLGGETANGDYFPDELYDALGSAVVDGDIVNKENRIVDVQARTDEEEHLNEGAKEAISMTMLAALLAIPGIAEAKTVHKEMKKAKTEQRTAVEAVDRMMSTTRKIGDYTEAQIANAITRTLYNEAQEDGDKGLYAVASVIFNRAEGNAADFVNVCKKRKQFSCWNKMTDAEWMPKNFKVRLSSTVADNSTNMKIWEKSKQIASDMVKGKFKPTINANSYYNPDKANPTWKKDMTDVEKIGSHLFGTVVNHGAFK